MRQVEAFHGVFAQALAAAGNAYTQAEAAAAGALAGNLAGPTGGGAMPLSATAAATPPFVFPANYVTAFISGSGIPVPSADYMKTVFGSYVVPNFPGGNLANALGLWTPAGLYPLTGATVLTLDESVAQGVSILHDTLVGTGVGQHGLIQPGGTPVVVQGISQGAIIASLEMQKLAAMPIPPTASELGFVLLGDPMNPNGGLFERFAGLTLPSLGQTFYGATPSNTVRPTHIYTLEYDGIADWPWYPINILSDINAFAGLYYVHGLYPFLDPSALPLGTTWFSCRPLRAIPAIPPTR
ncbi:PE-PPE domain-containing protein [Mycobacterium kansasii]